MKRLSFVALAGTLVVLMALIAISALVAQQAGGGPGGGMGGGGGMGRGGGRGGGGGSAMPTPEQIDQMLAPAGLTDAEHTAAVSIVRSKLNARRELTTALGKLRQVALDQNSSGQQFKQAIDDYNKALAAYRSRVEAEDRGLIKQLSPKSQARCLALGVLDNGLGMMGGRGGGGGRGGPGGGGGRRGAGGGGGRGGLGGGGAPGGDEGAPQ